LDCHSTLSPIWMSSVVFICIAESTDCRGDCSRCSALNSGKIAIPLTAAASSASWIIFQPVIIIASNDDLFAFVPLTDRSRHLLEVSRVKRSYRRYFRMLRYRSGRRVLFPD
jgi:hypothetical protein